MVRESMQRQRGASIVHWLLALAALLGFGALAIDLNFVYVSQAELQNAADAGALEGARQLYLGSAAPNQNVGQCAGPTCNCAALSPPDPACDAARANISQGSPVDVVSTRRGHWTFLTSFQDANGIERGGVFTANENTATAPTTASGGFRPLVDASLSNPSSPYPPPPSCSGQSESSYLTTDVNRDTCDVNAVQVCVARNAPRVRAIFARLLGISDFASSACAVAYIGWAGTINPHELDAPIALCEHLMIQDGKFSCQIGRWSTSSAGDEGAAKWTDFDQSHCDAASGNSVGGLIQIMSCGGSVGINPDTLHVPTPINVTGTGVAQNNLTAFFDQWQSCVASRTCADGSTSAFPTQPWTLRLPLIDCDDASNSSCNPLVSGVTVQVIWDNNQQSDSGFPTCMEGVDGFPDWNSSDPIDPEDPITTLNRWGVPLVPATQQRCVNAGFVWDAQGNNSRCIDNRVYSIGTTVIYDGTNGKEYDREEQVWDSFVRHFQLSMSTSAANDCQEATDDCGWWKGDVRVNSFADSDSGYRPGTLYFSPKCTGLELGETGGTLTFVRAKVPVLVY